MRVLTSGMAPKSDSTKPVYSSGWTTGLNPDITLDLGSAVDIQGVRTLQARGKNDGVYADSIQVFTSADNSVFAWQGTVFETDVWNPPTGYLWPSMWDSPSHDSQPYGGIYAHHFPLCFSGTVSARYVRFRMFNDNGPVYLSSLQILDRMTRRIVLDEFNQGFAVSTEKRASRGAKENVAGLVVASNPFRHSTIIVTGFPGARLEIFSQSGRLVRRLAACERVVWDGRDASGRVAPAGVYVIRLMSSGGTASARAVKL
jgi:hypothetical protein